MKRTISIAIGKGSIGHDNRIFYAPNVDKKRTSDNITLVSENIKEVYHELFDKALKEYNAKKKRKDRVIKDYYEHIYHSKQEKPFYEIIVQVGNKDDTPCNSQEGEIAKKILLQFAENMQSRNEHIRIFNSVLHMDEATPHLHIDFIPFATEQKRGLSTRNSLTKALEQQGFVARGKFDTSSKMWIDREKQVLARIMKQYGIEWEQLGTHNEHLSVLDYKKKERQREIEKLENKIDSANKSLETHRNLLVDSQRAVNEIGDKYQEIKTEYQNTEEKLSEKNAELAETSAALENNQKLLAVSADKVSKINKIDSIETGKTVFGGKVTVSQEDYTAISDLAKKQIAYESKENELSSEIEQLKSDNGYLRQEKSILIKENTNLKNEIKAVKSLKASLSNALNEIENWKRRYNKIMEFIERMDLTKKLQEYLKPVIKHRSR